MTPHIIRRAFSGLVVRRLPVVSMNKDSKSIPKLSTINGFCRISDSIRVENFLRQPPQKIFYQSQRKKLTTELNNDLQNQLNSTQTLEDVMNLISPELSGTETLQGMCICTYSIRFGKWGT